MPALLYAQIPFGQDLDFAAVIVVAHIGVVSLYLLAWADCRSGHERRLKVMSTAACQDTSVPSLNLKKIFPCSAADCSNAS